MSVDVIPPGQRRRIAVIGSGNKRMLSRGAEPACFWYSIPPPPERLLLSFSTKELIEGGGEEIEVKS